MQQNKTDVFIVRIISLKKRRKQECPLYITDPNLVPKAETQIKQHLICTSSQVSTPVEL
jgi:hypothetical protein